MIKLNSSYSISVEERDGGHVYQLLNDYDDVVLEKASGSAWASSEESLKAFGMTLIEEHEPFVVEGTFTVSNAISYELQFTDGMDMARLRYRKHDGTYEISGWEPIDDEWDDEANCYRSFVEANGFGTVPMNLVMRAN